MPGVRRSTSSLRAHGNARLSAHLINTQGVIGWPGVAWRLISAEAHIRSALTPCERGRMIKERCAAWLPSAILVEVGTESTGPDVDVLTVNMCLWAPTYGAQI